MSARKVQAAAHLAYKDQAALLERFELSEDYVSKDLQNLAKLGNYGKSPGNIKKGLSNLIGKPSMPGPDVIPVPMKILKPGEAKDEIDTVGLPILAPHKQLPHLYHKHRKRFNDMFFAGKDSGVLEEFWNTVEERQDPRLDGHEMCKRRDWKKRAIPVTIHGDEVPCTSIGKSGTKSYDCVSMQGVLSVGSTLAMKLFIAGLFACNKCSDRSTDQGMWAYISFSLWFAWLAISPDRDFGSIRAESAGKLLCDGFFFVIWLCKQDLKHLKSAYNLRHFGGKNPCELCECTAVKNDWNMNYANFADKAGWKQTVHTRSTWRIGELLHPLFQMCYLSCLNIEPDELHVMWIGVTSYLAGTILWLLCYQVLSGTPSANLQEVWSGVVKRYKELKTDSQFSSLNLNMFTDADHPHSDVPHLKGRGAEIKDIVAPLLAVWDAHMSNRRGEHKMIREVLQHQVDLQAILATHSKDPFLPVKKATDFAEITDLLLKKWSILSKNASDRNELLWPMVPKHHWLWHLAQRAMFLNPRVGNCAVDEDAVGRWKDIVAACANGTPAHKIPERFMEKMLWGMQILNTYGV